MLYTVGMDDHQETKQHETVNESSGDVSTEEKDFAAVGYIPPVSLYLFFKKRDSAFVRFHNKQALVLLACGIATWMLPLGKLLTLIVFIGSCFGFVAAVQGQWKDVPFAGPVSRGDWKGVRTTWNLCVHVVRTYLSDMRHRRRTRRHPPVSSGSNAS